MSTQPLDYRITIYAAPSEGGALLQPRTGASHNAIARFWTLPSNGIYLGYLQTPQGRRHRLDPLRRKIDTGQRVYRLLDKRLGSANDDRHVTQYMADLDGIDRWIGCLVVEEVSADLGACWEPSFTSRVFATRTPARGLWELTCRDLAEDLQKQIFVGRPHSSVSYAFLSPLIPHHLTHSYQNFIADPGVSGTKMAASPSEANRILLSFSHPQNLWVVVGQDLAQASTHMEGLFRVRRRFLGAPKITPTPKWYYKANRVQALVTTVGKPGGDVSGRFWLRSVLAVEGNGQGFAQILAVEELTAGEEGYATWASMGSTNQALTVELQRVDGLGGQTALFVSNVHVVEFLRDLLDGKFGQLTKAGDVTWAVRRDTAVGSIWDTMIADTTWGRVNTIISQATSLDRFVIDQLCLPFGLALVIDEEGFARPVDMRPGAAVGALPTLQDADLLALEDDERWSHSAADAITRVPVRYYQDIEEPSDWAVQTGDELPQIPAGLVRQIPKEIQQLSEPAPQRELLDIGVVDFPIDATTWHFARDYVTLDGSLAATQAQQRAAALGLSLLRVFHRGPRVIRAHCRRTAVPQATRIGDRRYLQLSDVPNPLDLQYGSGTFLCRVIEKTEEGPDILLVLLVEGVDTGAVAPTLGALTLGPDLGLSASIFQAVTLNAQGNPVELHYAITDQTVGTRPVESDPLWQYMTTQTQTATLQFAPLPHGKRIWVRGRSIDPGGLQPSAWVFPTAPGYVDTTGVSAPTGVTASNVTGTTADITWSGGVDGDRFVVYLRPGHDLVTPWSSAELIAQGQQLPRFWFLTGLTVLSDYTVGIAFLDAQGAIGAVGATTLSTTATPTVLPRPAGIAFDEWACINLQVFSADPNLDIEVERAPDLSGVPDTANSVSFFIPRHGFYHDPLPADDAVWWYRARHHAGSTGQTHSAWVGWLSAIARRQEIDPATPAQVAGGLISGGAPVPVLPSVSVSQSQAGGTGSLTLTILDPQGRLTLVEFQTEEFGNPPSAWTPDATVPYNTTVPYAAAGLSFIRWRITGYDGNGVVRILASGQGQFGQAVGLALDDLIDVAAPTPAAGEGIVFDGTEYIPLQLARFGLVFVFPSGSIAGDKVVLAAPVAGAFAAWRARLDASSDATFHVRRAAGITGALASVGGTQPSVSAGLGAEDTNGLDWTTTGFARGDPIEVELVTLTLPATAASLTLECDRV